MGIRAGWDLHRVGFGQGFLLPLGLTSQNRPSA